MSYDVEAVRRDFPILARQVNNCLLYTSDAVDE